MLFTQGQTKLVNFKKKYIYIRLYIYVYFQSGVLSVMPAATVHSQSFNESPIQDVALMAKEPFPNGIHSQNAVHAQYVLQLLRIQRQAGFLCDITIHVKDRSFKAHKPLLAACSLYFR